MKARRRRTAVVSLETVLEKHRPQPLDVPDYSTMPVDGVQLTERPLEAEIERHIGRYGPSDLRMPAGMRNIAWLREWAEQYGLPMSEAYLRLLWDAYRVSPSARTRLSAVVKRVATIADVLEVSE
jgi:hypothetical protein